MSLRSAGNCGSFPGLRSLCDQATQSCGQGRRGRVLVIDGLLVSLLHPVCMSPAFVI